MIWVMRARVNPAAPREVRIVANRFFAAPILQTGSQAPSVGRSGKSGWHFFQLQAGAAFARLPPNA